MTQEQHLALVTQWIQQNQQSVGISPNTILRFVDRANLHVWKILAPQYPNDYRKEYTGKSDGSLLPVDWMVWAGSAYYTDGGGTVRPFHYIHPEQLGFELNNSLGKAQTYFPALYFEDMKIRTVPEGLTGIGIWGFNGPTKMVGAAPTDDDGMPPMAVGYVHAETAEALKELSMDEEKSEETLMRRLKESVELDEKLFTMMEQAMRGEVRSTIK